MRHADRSSPDRPFECQSVLHDFGFGYGRAVADDHGFGGQDRCNRDGAVPNRTECRSFFSRADRHRSGCPRRGFSVARVSVVFGQKHYSGTYWSATESRHVIYESRLELARLLYADFDRSVQRICAQPFLLSCVVNNVERKHIPDYFLMTTSGPKVVDVKPARRLSVPEVVSTFEWTRSAIERRG